MEGRIWDVEVEAGKAVCNPLGWTILSYAPNARNPRHGAKRILNVEFSDISILQKRAASGMK